MPNDEDASGPAFCACSVTVVSVFTLLITFWTAWPYAVSVTFIGLDISAAASELTNATTGAGEPFELTFIARVANPNGLVRVRHHYVRADVWYRGRKVAGGTVPAFEQPRHGRTLVRVPVTVPAAPLSGAGGDAEMLAADLARGVVPVRAVVSTRYRFSRRGWSSWAQREHQVCDRLTFSPPWAPWGGRLLAVSCYSHERREQANQA